MPPPLTQHCFATLYLRPPPYPTHCSHTLADNTRRNMDVRAALLERGAEGLLRRVKAEAGAASGEAASDALRDLGLENYN